MKRLRAGEWIALAGAIALIASLFLHWYGTEGGGAEATAWQAFGILDVVLVLLALVPVALFATQATRSSPAIPVFFSVMTIVAPDRLPARPERAGLRGAGRLARARRRGAGPRRRLALHARRVDARHAAPARAGDAGARALDCTPC